MSESEHLKEILATSCSSGKACDCRRRPASRYGLRCDAEAALQISTLHRSDAANMNSNRQRPVPQTIHSAVAVMKTWCPAKNSSFRGARSASPESILTMVVMDSGPAHPSRLLPTWMRIPE
jgi:hypothetical protein